MAREGTLRCRAGPVDAAATARQARRQQLRRLRANAGLPRGGGPLLPAFLGEADDTAAGEGAGAGGEGGGGGRGHGDRGDDDDGAPLEVAGWQQRWRG